MAAEEYFVSCCVFVTEESTMIRFLMKWGDTHRITLDATTITTDYHHYHNTNSTVNNTN